MVKYLQPDWWKVKDLYFYSDVPVILSFILGTVVKARPQILRFSDFVTASNRHVQFLQVGACREIIWHSNWREFYLRHHSNIQRLVRVQTTPSLLTAPANCSYSEAGRPTAKPDHCLTQLKSKTWKLQNDLWEDRESVCVCVFWICMSHSWVMKSNNNKKYHHCGWI